MLITPLVSICTYVLRGRSANLKKSLFFPSKVSPGLVSAPARKKSWFCPWLLSQELLYKIRAFIPPERPKAFPQAEGNWTYQSESLQWGLVPPLINIISWPPCFVLCLMDAHSSRADCFIIKKASSFELKEEEILQWDPARLYLPR